VSAIRQEIATQPQMWATAGELAPTVAGKLPGPGKRVAVVGCGTSFYIAQAIAALREALGHGETDAFVASEMPVGREYDLVIALSRSGTTTEVLRCLDTLPKTAQSLAITAVSDSPVAGAATDAIDLPFADEESIVQTRFATTALALLRCHLGDSIEAAMVQAQDALEQPLAIEPSDFEHFVFLGHGWSAGLASEGALKLREAGRAWAESYPAMEYRHGPISVASSATLVWFLGGEDQDLVRDVRATGATALERQIDPMAELVRVQRVAVALAQSKGLDPDQPRHLSRSVVLG
jgi:fructoselysine-6-P-deglycase FrlB-like protein